MPCIKSLAYLICYCHNVQNVNEMLHPPLRHHYLAHRPRISEQNKTQSWGGGPQKGAANGDLSTINPKNSPIKQRTWHSFEGSYELLGPVRSH